MIRIKDIYAKNALNVLHFRYSSKANASQNVDDTLLITEIKKWLESKGFAVWCIFTDGRIKHTSFKGVREHRTDPFPFKVKNTKTNESADMGKLFHMGVLDALLDNKNLKGMIGNTSGTLDVAGLIGHRLRYSQPFQSLEIHPNTS